MQAVHHRQYDFGSILEMTEQGRVRTGDWVSSGGVLVACRTAAQQSKERYCAAACAMLTGLVHHRSRL
jgi:hypothetical protein